MATKLYFHDAAFTGWPGTFPSGEQSAVTPTSTATGGATLRSMDTTKGTAQASVATATTAVTTAQNQLIRMFVSPVLAAGDTISSMNVWCAVSQTNLNVNLTLSFNIYAWNPSTGTKTAGVDAINGTQIIAAEQTSAGVEQVYGANTTVTSFSAPAGNVIVFEVWAKFTQGMATAYSTSFFYDGTTESTTLNATVSNIAAYLEFPNITLQFAAVESLATDITASATHTGDLSQTSFSVALVGTATGVDQATLPPYSAGDLILGTAFVDGSTTLPTVPSGWTTVTSAVNTSTAAVLVSQTALADSTVPTSSGVFTNATSVAFNIYSGVDDTTPIGNVVSSTGNSSTATLSALTLSAPATNPFDVNFVATATPTVTFPTGFKGTQRALPANGLWNGLTYGSTFVATRFNSSAVATSTDGATWVAQSVPIFANWRAVAHGNNTYVAVAQSSSIAISSPNATTWTQQTLPASGTWQAIAYGNSIFLAITVSGGIAASSADGAAWTSLTMPTTSSWAGLTFGLGKFVAVGGSGTSQVAVTTDGTSWSTYTMPGISSTWKSVAYGAGVFVAVCSLYDAATSPDGVTWTRRALPVSASLESVTFGNGLFVAVATGSTIALTSPDGITWTQRTLPVSASWAAVAYGNRTFATVATSSSTAADIGVWAEGLQLRASQADAVDAIATYDSGGAAPQETV